MFGREPRLWRYVWRPVVLAAILFVGLFAAGFWVLSRSIGDGGPLGQIAAALVLVVVVYFAGTAAFLTIAAILGSFAWDRLTREVEILTVGHAADTKLSGGAVAADTVLRLLFTLALGLCGMCCGIVVPVVGGAVFAGAAGLFDCTASAYLHRGVTLSGQLRQAPRLPGWTGFAAICGLATLVPLLNVLALPILVAGGTIMVARAEGRVPVN